MKKQLKTRIFSFDTEDDSKGNCYLYNFYDVQKDAHHTFTNQYDALDFTLSQRVSIFWATNLEYDINNLFRNHYSLLGYTFAGSRLLAADVIDSDGSKSDKIRFYDTMNHWQFSVKEMGRRIGLEKLEMDHEGKSDVTAKVIEYCRRDTEITGKFVKQMTDVYESIGCKLKMTIASTTLNFFETHYHGKISHPFTQEQIDFFHEGYYGGRTEIFYNEPVQGNIFYHDINSLYPAAMLNNFFPDFSDYHETKNPDFNLEGMAKVQIQSPKDLHVPYLPTKHDKKLVFALGSFTGVYTYFEIREALKLGYRVKSVQRAIEFKGRTAPFRTFIADIYERRLQAKKKKDGLMDLAFKNLMNYCYGKFAQGNEITKMTPIHAHHLKSGDVIFFDLVLTKEKTEYPRYANCIWACYVTAYARHELFQALTKVDNKKARLLYCDTDSVLYENKNQILEHSDELGKFKLEGRFKYAHFKLPKLYTLIDADDTQTYRTKGVPRAEYKNGVMVRNIAKEFFESGRAEFRKPNKLRETLRRNLSKARVRGDTPKMIPNYWELRDKSTNAKYTKRRVLKTGLTTPLILG